MILLASTCVATAHATDYAHFGATTDSIRILGNTTSATTAFTREMRIRVAPGSELGHVLSEQRDAVEAKITRIGALEFKQDDIRGYTCGSVTMSPLDATFAGGWHHVAHVRDGSTARLFIDGVLMQEQTGLATCTADSSDSAMAIGRFVYGTPCCFGLPLPSFLGDLDWIRVSDVARYSTNFTPPMESTITADTSTELLLKFNEPAGTATLIDESDHQFVCDVGVSMWSGMTVTAPTLGNTLHATDAVQWRVEDGGNGHWYIASANRMTFPTALAWSQAAGGHLATIGSAGENAILFDLARTTPEAWVVINGHVVNGPFFGAQQLSTNPGYSEPSGGWRWVTGESLDNTYTNFCQSQPDNNSGGGQSVGSFYATGDQQYSCWDDIFDATQFTSLPWTFLVEWDADCNNDGLVDYGQCRDGSLPDFNGNNIPDCCEQGTACVVGSYPVQWRIADGGNGHWYQRRSFTTSDVSFDTARVQAEHAGGTLASIHSQAENELVRRINRNQFRSYWLGAVQVDPNCSGTGCAWRWLTGEPWTFENWCCGGDTNVGNEDCLASSENGEWNSVLCIGGQGMGHYMVEWSDDCNNDGIVDYGQILNGQLADSDANGVPDACEGLQVPSQYPTIQAAIDAVGPRTSRVVQVAAGTYNESFALNGKDVTVRGAPRDATILDGVGLVRSIATFSGGEPNTASLENLVFRNGSAGSRIYPKAPFTVGGAVYGHNSAASIRNCVFQSCTADFGGAIYLIFSQVLVDSCSFESNLALQEGGGLMIYETTGAVRACAFIANRCGLAGPGSGSAFKSVGAFAMDDVIVFENCTVTGDVGSSFGSALEHYQNNASVRGVLRIVGSNISGNLAGDGASGLRVLGNMDSCILAEGTSICGNEPTNVEGPYLIEGSVTVCDCHGDLTGDGVVNAADLGVLLSSWGLTGPSGVGDTNHDGLVNAADVSILLSGWGACPN